MAALGEDLLGTVNKLQDLVFNTIGNDSLDLPQIVSWNIGFRLFLFGGRLIFCRLSLAPSRLENPQSLRTSSVETFYLGVAASSLEDHSFFNS